MKLIDLTHSVSRRSTAGETIPLVVRSVDSIDRVPLESLVTPATVVDLTDRLDQSEITRRDMAGFGVSGIAGCILRTDWCDRYLSGFRADVPEFTLGAAAYLLEGGVRTIASDFPMSADAADLLLHNNCVLVHCLSNIAALDKEIVRLVALPLKFNDTFSADARVIAIEE